MTTTAQPCEHRCEQPPALAQVDYGALAYMLTFEEIDDAIDVLERIISSRESEDETMPRYNTSGRGGLALNIELHAAIDQLRAERTHRAIPEAIMDAAIEQLDGTADDDRDDDTRCDCDHQ